MYMGQQPLNTLHPIMQSGETASASSFSTGSFPGDNIFGSLGEIGKNDRPGTLTKQPLGFLPDGKEVSKECKMQGYLWQCEVMHFMVLDATFWLIVQLASGILGCQNITKTD
eukprot:Gb_02830 [translate_table: standard]